MPSKTLTSPRRGLSEAEAALYVGIGSTKFRELVVSKAMPGPRVIGARRIWDIAELDAAFDSLPVEGVAPRDSWADFRASNGNNQTQAR